MQPFWMIYNKNSGVIGPVHYQSSGQANKTAISNVNEDNHELIILQAVTLVTMDSEKVIVEPIAQD